MEYFEKKYTRQMLNRVGCIPTLLLFIALSFSLDGCKTIQEKESFEIRDTTHISKADSLSVYQKQSVRDTILKIIERIITINEGGDTLKEVNNNYIRESHIETDSSAYYRALFDSLMRVTASNASHEKVVEKEPSLWERWKTHIVTYALVIAAIVLIIIIERLILRKRNKQIDYTKFELCSFVGEKFGS